MSAIAYAISLGFLTMAVAMAFGFQAIANALRDIAEAVRGNDDDSPPEPSGPPPPLLSK